MPPRGGRTGAGQGGSLTGANGAFQGFPPEAFAFLADLAANNDKAWFEAHRDVYDGAVVSPALAFTAAMGAALHDVAPTVLPEPRVGGSLFRIHRDTRFSADKRPYKTHVGIRLRDRDTAASSKCTGPLFYVEFDARHLRLGVGVKAFDPRTLAAFRDAVAEERDPASALNDMVRRAETLGHAVLGDTLKRVPPAYAGQSGHALLRRKGLFVRHQAPLPGAIHGPGFVAFCKRWFRPYAPLFHGLRDIAAAGLE